MLVSPAKAYHHTADDIEILHIPFHDIRQIEAQQHTRSTEIFHPFFDIYAKYFLLILHKRSFINI